MDRRCNFHTHTSRCKHATGTPLDYCEAALSAGVSVLGFSDHAPFPDGRWKTVRMAQSELPQYVADVREAQRRYAGRVVVYLGLECEYVRGLRGYLRDELLGRQGLDYLVAAAHQYPFGGEGHWCSSFSQSRLTPAQLYAYTDYVLETLGSGLYDVLAHPDLFGMGLRHWDDDARACSQAICQAARQQGVFLEINANGFRKPYLLDGGVVRRPYPLRPFWEVVAEEGAQAISGSDAHRPALVWAQMDECRAIADACGLTLANERLAERLAARRGGGCA